MTYALPRREFLTHSAAGLAALGFASGARFASAQEEKKEAEKAKEPPFKISLAEWSLHKRLFADRASNDTPEAQGQVGTSRRGLHLFRRQVSNYVLYELTPHAQPRLLDLCELTVTPARS